MTDMGYTEFCADMTRTTSFSAEFALDVLKLLDAIGYPMREEDVWLLGYCVQMVDWEIKNACNIQKVPEGLYKVAQGLIVASFLDRLSARGVLTKSGELSFDGAIKRLQEGDTNIEFVTDSTTSDEQKLKQFIADCNRGREQFIRYRRLAW